MADALPQLAVIWTAAKGTPKDLSASVAAVDVEDHDRLLDKATVVLRDPNTSAPKITRGDRLEITLGWVDEKAVLFSGPVVNLKAGAPANGSASLTVVGFDRGYAMQAKRSDAHYKGRLSEVVYQVAAAYQAAFTVDRKNIVCDPDPIFDEAQPLTQHNLTDLQFLQWLALRYGHRAFVEHDGTQSRFYFASNHALLKGDPMGVLQWCHGLRQLKSWEMTSIAAHAVRQRVAAVPHPTSGEPTPSTGDAPPPIDPVLADPQHAATIGKGSANERARYEQGNTGTELPPDLEPEPLPGLPSDPKLADAVTTWDPTRAQGLQGKGTAVGTVKLRAKGKVTIRGLPPWAEGDWYVNVATHSWRDTSVGSTRSATYETSFVVTR